jgi:3-phenylpropionate/trans-cinnamate dioxygenase ferredoxin reductase subunit
LFSFFAKQRPTTALINAISVGVNPKETLLQAALRQGIDFPHSCRVGGCASCKCKLVSGKVRELTETGYILPDAELNAGYILACQSVPKGELRIEVDLARQQAKRKVRGKVVAQDKLTHDISPGWSFSWKRA